MFSRLSLLRVLMLAATVIILAVAFGPYLNRECVNETPSREAQPVTEALAFSEPASESSAPKTFGESNDVEYAAANLDMETLLEELGALARPKDADDRYRENIALALRGDPQAAYEVSRSLFECSRSVRSANLQGRLDSEDLSGALAAMMEARSRSCTYIHDNFDDARLRADAESWRVAAEAYDGPMVRLHSSIRDGLAPPPSLIEEALTSGHPEVYSLIYQHATTSDADPEVVAAWSVVSCTVDRYCDPIELADGLEEASRPNELDLVMAELEQILRAIKSQDYRALADRHFR